MNEPYRGLPPLAGLCSFEDAQKKGLSVDQCVDRLKRYHYAFQRLLRIFNMHLTAEPVYELKMAYSYHGYLCSQHADALRNRVAEMRHPPLGLEKTPHPALALLFDEIEAGRSATELLAGVYGKVLPSLLEGVERHLAETNPLADAPSARVLRFARIELAEMLDYGAAAMQSFPVDDESDDWLALLDHCLEQAGGLDGADPVESDLELMPMRSVSPPDYEAALLVPRRDERFPDPYNMGVHAEQFLYNPDFPNDAKTLMMYFKRLREIDVPEMMAPILIQSEGKPWEFYRDMMRQLWDEARHAMMGEAGFVKLGLPWADLVRVNFTWSLGLNEQLDPAERHAVLWFIEQGLMTKTGKRYEWEVGKKSGDPLAETFQDYDWADEVLHARIGRTHYVETFDSIEEASANGNRCWSKVVSDWEAWKQQGLTEHENWWPALYRAYCEKTGRQPDPGVLAFHETYADTRADLERIAASG